MVTGATITGSDVGKPNGNCWVPTNGLSQILHLSLANKYFTDNTIMIDGLSVTDSVGSGLTTGVLMMKQVSKK